MSFAVKIHRDGVQVLLAGCDAELVGTSHAEGSRRIDVHAGFYDDERVDEDVLERLLGGCTMANLVGKRCIAVARRLELVDHAAVLAIADVEHAQMLVMG